MGDRSPGSLGGKHIRPVHQGVLQDVLPLKEYVEPKPKEGCHDLNYIGIENGFFFPELRVPISSKRYTFTATKRLNY
jgi:hypothetical protein